MPVRYDTPQDAEDAFYDAIDEANLVQMLSVWEQSADVACAMPMQPLQTGIQGVNELWKRMLNPQMRVEISVRHLHWIEQGEVAIHLVEQTVSLVGNPQKQPPIYGFNVYRKGADGWRMLIHTNSPTPPPPGARPF